MNPALVDPFLTDRPALKISNELWVPTPFNDNVPLISVFPVTLIPVFVTLNLSVLFTKIFTSFEVLNLIYSSSSAVPTIKFE